MCVVWWTVELNTTRVVKTWKYSSDWESNPRPWHMQSQDVPLRYLEGNRSANAGVFCGDYSIGVELTFNVRCTISKCSLYFTYLIL